MYTQGGPTNELSFDPYLESSESISSADLILGFWDVFLSAAFFFLGGFALDAAADAEPCLLVASATSHETCFNASVRVTYFTSFSGS